MSILRTVLVVFGGVFALVAVTVATLILVFDMRVELAGSTVRPIFSFGSAEDHYSALEHNRSQHYSRLLPAPPSASGPAALPEATSDTAPGPAPSRIDPGSSAQGAYWTDYRGPDRDGHYRQTPILTEWPETGLEPLWRQPIGAGYASFVVADGLAFTIEQRREQEVVAAYDVATGREVWTHEWVASFNESLGGPGPRATPTWQAGRLYALGATGHLWSLDATSGDVIWHRDILNDAAAANLQWAMAASPLVVDDLVIVQPGGSEGWSIVAYDRSTGDVVWHALDDVQSYTSPMAVTLDRRRQLLVVTAERVAGLDLRSGDLLWGHPWVTPNMPNAAQPLVIGSDRVFLSAGYGHGATVIAVNRSGDRFEVEEVWRNHRMKNTFSSSVLHEGYVYGLDESILACMDAETGELQWKGGRYGHGQLLLADGHLVVLTERGDLALVRATPEGHQEIGRSDAIEGKTWNVPALTDGRLLVRNARQMAAFDLSLP